MVTDTSADTWAFSNASRAHLELGFTDNVAINGAGNDLVLWEIGTPDDFGMSLTVGGFTHRIMSVSSGFTNAQGFGINIAFLDLDDLGVAPGAAISSIVVKMGFPFVNTSVSPTLGAVAALHSGRAPEPTSLLLLAVGLAAIGVRRKRA